MKKLTQNTRKSRPRERSFWTNWKIWRARSVSTVVSDLSQSVKKMIQRDLSSVIRRLMRCLWLLVAKDLVQRITTLTLCLTLIQLKSKSLKIVRDSFRVQLMVTMFVSSLMDRLDLERLLLSKETMPTQAWLLVPSSRCSISFVRCLTSTKRSSVTWWSFTSHSSETCCSHLVSQ